jgi:hypothetical protein
MTILLAVLDRALNGLLDRRIHKVRGQIAGRIQVRFHHRPADRLAHILGQQYRSARSGGGLYVIRNSGTGGLVTLINSRVTQNTSRYGGGILVTSGYVVLAGTSTITENTAWFGGGIYSDGGTVRAADGVATTDPITQTVLPAWTGSVTANISNGGQTGTPPNGPDCFGGGWYYISCG